MVVRRPSMLSTRVQSLAHNCAHSRRVQQQSKRLADAYLLLSPAARKELEELCGELGVPNRLLESSCQIEKTNPEGALAIILNAGVVFGEGMMKELMHARGRQPVFAEADVGTSRRRSL